MLGGAMVKNPPLNVDVNTLPGLGRSPGNTLQCSWRSPVFLPGEVHREECGGIESMGPQRV